MGRRICPRTFVILAAGGVKVRWACGTEKVYPHEARVDVEDLAAHLPTAHHHHHLHHKE